MSAAVTRTLAGFALREAEELPEAVRSQARRAFVNYVGCALGGVDEAASTHAFALADEFSGARVATVIGRAQRLDAQNAALVNCLQSSIQTFDDTHLPSVLHPTGPVAAAMLALLQQRPALAVSGAEFLASLAYGIEVACRVALALTAPPSRMHLGAFTTGIVGGIGAAVGCARLLGLDVQKTAWAIGIAAAQGGGIRATHATMAGGWIPALGARAGLEAALLAARGFDCNEAALEGRNGLLEVFAPGADAGLALLGLGETYEIAELAFKPYPCGVVIHPAIDACLELVAQAQGTPIASALLTVSPLCLQLASTRHPRNALSCNVSLFHWAAAALVRARAGLAEASEEALHDAAIVALRDRIDAVADESLLPHAAAAEVRLADGRVLGVRIEHARGSRGRPLTDQELAAKFIAMAQPRLGGAGASALLALCESLPTAGAAWLETFAARAVPR